VADEESKVVISTSVEGVEASEEAYERISSAIKKTVLDSEKAAAAEQKAVRALEVQQEKSFAATEKLIDSAVSAQLKQSKIQEGLALKQINLDDKLIDKTIEKQLALSDKVEDLALKQMNRDDKLVDSAIATQLKLSKLQEDLALKQMNLDDKLIDKVVEKQLALSDKEEKDRLKAQANAFSNVGKAVGKIGGAFKNFGNVISGAIRNLTAFRPEYLSIMFFGMALSRVFERNIQDILELTGVTKTYAVTMRLMLLPVMMPLVKAFYSLIIPIMKLPEPIRALVGGFVLLVFALGKAMFLVGTLVLGMFGLLGVVGNLIATMISLSFTVIGMVFSLAELTGALILTTLAMLGLDVAEKILELDVFLLELAFLALGFMLLTFLLPIIMTLIGAITLLLAPFLLVGGVILGVLALALKALYDWLTSSGVKFDEFTKLLQEAWTMLKSGDWVGVLGKIGEAVSWLWNTLVEGLKSIDWGAILDTVIQAFKTAIQWLKEIDWLAVITSLWETIKSAGGFVLDAFSYVIKALKDSRLLADIAELAGVLVNALCDFIISVDWISLLSQLFTIFYDIGKTLASMIWDAMFAFFKTVDWSKVKDAIILGITGVGASVLAAGAGATIGVQRGFMSSLADLIGLQRGGVITRPTLAVVGEKGPEAVVPLNQEGAVSDNVDIRREINIANMVSDMDEIIEGVVSGIVGASRRIMSGVSESLLDQLTGRTTPAVEGSVFTRLTFEDLASAISTIQPVTTVVAVPTLAPVKETNETIRETNTNEETSNISFSPNVYVTANVASDMDIDLLADKITRRWNDDLRRLLIRK
jgi:hypothetical protein